MSDVAQTTMVERGLHWGRAEGAGERAMTHGSAKQLHALACITFSALILCLFLHKIASTWQRHRLTAQHCGWSLQAGSRARYGGPDPLSQASGCLIITGGRLPCPILGSRSIIANLGVSDNHYRQAPEPDMAVQIHYQKPRGV